MLFLYRLLGSVEGRLNTYTVGWSTDVTVVIYLPPQVDLRFAFKKSYGMECKNYLSSFAVDLSKNAVVLKVIRPLIFVFILRVKRNRSF